jgi:hypothetical protein
VVDGRVRIARDVLAREGGRERVEGQDGMGNRGGSGDGGTVCEFVEEDSVGSGGDGAWIRRATGSYVGRRMGGDVRAVARWDVA